MSVFTLSVMIFNDLKNIYFKRWNINETFVEFPNLLPGTLESDKTQYGLDYSQTSFLKLFGSKYNSKCIFAIGKIPTQLARWGTWNLPRQLDPLQFRSTTYEVKGYEQKENLLNGIKTWYSQMLGHSHTKVRSMVPTSGCSPGHWRRGNLFILLLWAHRGRKTIHVRFTRKATNLCIMKE